MTIVIDHSQITGQDPYMDSMAISKFKATCLAVCERVRKTGQPILITRHGKPVAQIVPPPEPEPQAKSTFGCMKGEGLEIVGDIVEPLFPDGWEMSPDDPLNQ